jgi:hypothetical protein
LSKFFIAIRRKEILRESAVFIGIEVGGGISELK